MIELPDLPPRRSRGRPALGATDEYHEDVLEPFGNALWQYQTEVTRYKSSMRGWAYAYEPAGIDKDEGGYVSKVINDCRKLRFLPLNFIAEDEGRAVENLSYATAGTYETPEERAKSEISDCKEYAGRFYIPYGFWRDQEYYVEVATEKIDLLSLFKPYLKKFHIPITNLSGWSDYNRRAEIMERFQIMESLGKRVVFLYCGDHDPSGLQISKSLRSNFEELSYAVDWYPDNLEIVRFGLNFDFIEKNKLPWIPNLKTGKGDLANPKHPNHWEAWVQDYIAEYGIRKCESNAIIIAHEAGRRLIRETVDPYIDMDAAEQYESDCDEGQAEVNQLVGKQFKPWRIRL